MKISNSKERLRFLLDYYGMKQSEFCQKTHIQKSALSNYLTGYRVPRQDQIDAIASSFNLDPAWLMGYDVPMFLEVKETDFTDDEVRVLIAYRNADSHIQEAVNKLLDIHFNHIFTGQMPLFGYDVKTKQFKKDE